MHVLISALSRFCTPTGICRHAANLAAGLLSRNEIERITFVTGSWQQHYFQQMIGMDTTGRFQLLPITIPNDSIQRNRWFARELPRLARLEGADIVHLSFPVPVLAGKFDCKTVVTLHDLYPYDCPQVFGFPNAHINRLFLRMCLNNSDAIACVSETTRDRAQALLPKCTQGKLSVIPNSLSPTVADAHPPAGWRKGAFILSVAQHRANKNLTLAVEGFRAMLDRSVVPENCRFVLVGCAGPETASIKRRTAELGLDEKLVLLDSVPDSELRWLYQNCTLFVITSKVEGFCLPLLEAMAEGCRIICSDIPILREIGSSSCHYFSLNEQAAENFVTAASTALAGTGTSKHDALDRFQASAVSDAYVRLYNDLLGTRHSEPVPSFS